MHDYHNVRNLTYSNILAEIVKSCSAHGRLWDTWTSLCKCGLDSMLCENNPTHTTELLCLFSLAGTSQNLFLEVLGSSATEGDNVQEDLEGGRIAIPPPPPPARSRKGCRAPWDISSVFVPGTAF